MDPAENTNAARVASRGRGGAGPRGGTGRRQQRGAADGNGGGPRGCAGRRPSRGNPANRREAAGGPGASGSTGRPRGGVRAGDRTMPRARRPRASRRQHGPGDSDAGSSTSGSSRVNPRTSGTPHRPHRRADAAGEMGAAGVGLPEQTTTGQTPVVANRQIRFPRWARRGRSPRLRTHTPTDPACPFPTQPGEWHPLQPPEERRPAEAAANNVDQHLFSRRTAAHPAHQGATPRRRRRRRRSPPGGPPLPDAWQHLDGLDLVAELRRPVPTLQDVPRFLRGAIRGAFTRALEQVGTPHRGRPAGGRGAEDTRMGPGPPPLPDALAPPASQRGRRSSGPPQSHPALLRRELAHAPGHGTRFCPDAGPSAGDVP